MNNSLGKQLLAAGIQGTKPIVGARLVGIHIPPASPGTVTVPATQVVEGRIYFGPSSELRTQNLLSDQQLVGAIEAHKLIFTRVKINPAKQEVEIGRFLRELAWEYACSGRDCGNTKIINVPGLSKLRHLTGEETVRCEICGQIMVRGQNVEADPLAEHVQAMIKFWKEKPVPEQETINILPRIWGVYPAGQTPVEWAPTDEKAREIATRTAAHNREIRPISVTEQAGAANLIGALCEASEDIQMGWIAPSSMSGMTWGGVSYRLMPQKRFKVEKGLAV